MKLLDKLDPVWKQALANRGIEAIPSSNDLAAMSMTMERGDDARRVQVDLGGDDVRDRVGAGAVGGGIGGGSAGGTRAGSGGAGQAELAPTVTGAITQDDLDALAELTPKFEPRNPLSKAFWKRHCGTDALVGNWLWCIGTVAYMVLAIFKYSEATTVNKKVSALVPTWATAAAAADLDILACLPY